MHYFHSFVCINLNLMLPRYVKLRTLAVRFNYLANKIIMKMHPPQFVSLYFMRSYLLNAERKIFKTTFFKLSADLLYLIE